MFWIVWMWPKLLSTQTQRAAAAVTSSCSWMGPTTLRLKKAGLSQRQAVMRALAACCARCAAFLPAASCAT